MAAAQYLSAGIGFLSGIIAARLLGPSDYGTATLVMAYPSLLWSFVQIKSASVTTRYISSFRAANQHEEIKGLYKLSLCVDFVAAVAYMVVGMTHHWVSGLVQTLLHISWLMVVYAISFPFYSLVGASWAILSSWRRFQWLTLFQVLHRMITLFIVIVFLIFGYGILGLVLANAIADTAIGLIMVSSTTYLLYRNGLGFWWNGSVRKVAPQLKELRASFSWNYMAVTLGGLIGHVPALLLGRYRGQEEAGFYRLAMSLTTIGSYLEQAFGRVVYPVLSERWSSGERESLYCSPLSQGALELSILWLT